MKEILKYLRQTNSFTQEQVANKLEISRQTYIKYENGEISPSDKIIRKLAILYNVTENFIRKNEIPKPQTTPPDVYKINKNEGYLTVADSGTNYKSSINNKNNERVSLDGYFDGNCVRILDMPSNINLKKGQRLKLYIENEQEEMQKRQEAFDTLMKLIKKGKPCTDPPDKDPYYKEALYEALEEKYGPFN